MHVVNARLDISEKNNKSNQLLKSVSVKCDFFALTLKDNRITKGLKLAQKFIYYEITLEYLSITRLMYVHDKDDQNCSLRPTNP